MSDRYAAASSLWLDDLEPGQRIHLPPTECGEDRVARYAELFDARHPINMDEDYARATRYGHRIVHGPLPLAATLAALGDAVGLSLVAMAAIEEWQFLAPVRVGALLAPDVHVIGIERGARSGTVTFEIRLLDADGRLAQRGVARLVLRRSQG